jgi:hypothetical protein
MPRCCCSFPIASSDQGPRGSRPWSKSTTSSGRGFPARCFKGRRPPAPARGRPASANLETDWQQSPIRGLAQPRGCSRAARCRAGTSASSLQFGHGRAGRRLQPRRPHRGATFGTRRTKRFNAALALSRARRRLTTGAARQIPAPPRGNAGPLALFVVKNRSSPRCHCRSTGWCLPSGGQELSPMGPIAAGVEIPLTPPVGLPFLAARTTFVGPGTP